MTLSLWPSIDLRDGRVVRLLKGRLEDETRYDVAPEDVLRRFEDEGAAGIHIVDLDAAFEKGSNSVLIRKLLASRRVPVQVGGGLRTQMAVESVLKAGASRAVLGSLPFTDPTLFATILEVAGPGRIVVALDCRNGRPAIRGWVEDSGAPAAVEAASDLERKGLRTLLVTDIDRDGAMNGPNLDLLASIRSSFSGEILASGGVRGPEDLPSIEAVLTGGEAGVILGRALHEGKTSVAELRAASTVGRIS
jgi:phosphoribosylformimino-5-aminoimidazole carboxamide ribotide isomerase